MKKVHIFLFFLLSYLGSMAQNTTCTPATFSVLDPAWTFSSGINWGGYNNPANGCAPDTGIITPGVGGNNPGSFLTPTLVSDGHSLNVAFDIFRFNSNLSCNSWSNYACPTSMDIDFQVGNTIIPAITDLLLPPNGPNNNPRVSTTFAMPAAIPTGTVYRLRISFKPKSGSGNCNQPGTKYVFDNFYACPATSPDVIDAINDSYCDATNGDLVVNGNVSNNDLSFSGANVVYSVISAPIANGSTTPGGATLVLNPDGTFTITRTDPLQSVFTFTYLMTETTIGQTDMAQVVVCFSEGGPVPVQLSAFTAARKNGIVSLTWKTEHESELAQFQIERNSGNGFLSIGSVKPMNAVNGSGYQFNDELPSKLASSYRLRIIEKDGKYSFSTVKSITALPESVVVYPNPSNGQVQVFIDAATGHLIDITLFNQTGSRIRQFNNYRNRYLSLTGLETGNYLIRVQNRTTGKTTVEKLTVL